MHTGVKEVHRPGSLEEAVRLLARPGVRTAPLHIWPRPLEGLLDAEAAIDLSGLGLDAVRVTEGGLALGAAATLETVLASPIGGTPAGALIREACRTSAPSGIRAVASVGGAVLSREPSDLLLALRVLDAVGVLRGMATREVPLEGLAPGPGELLLEVRIPPAPPGFGAALERVARTPRDRSIVAAAAALQVEGGFCARARLALLGVAPEVVRWRSGEMEIEGQPLTAEGIARAASTVEAQAISFSDHLAGEDYRRAAATVLVRRALTGTWQHARGHTGES